MKHKGYIVHIFLSVAIAAMAVAAQTSNERQKGMRFIPDVPHAFYNLTEYADPLGLNITTTPDPSSCRHYQGMARLTAADGTPFFYLTRSGNTPFPPGEAGCFDSPGETRNGHLVVFKMDSRDRNGERLRSNRLKKGLHINDTVPNAFDRATVYFTIVGGDPEASDPAKRPGLILRDGLDSSIAPPRVYQHPGGMQQVGNMLAIPLEAPRQNGSGADFDRCILDLDLDACNRYFNYPKAPYPSAIHFYDVSVPEEPKFKSQFIPVNAAGEVLDVAGTVGLTQLQNGKYLMVLTGGSDNEHWHFYRSNGTDLSSTTLTWQYIDTVAGPDTLDAHQTLNFLREGNIDGNLYIAGARGRVLATDRDKIDLYEVHGQTKNFEPGEVTIPPHFLNKAISPFPSSGGNKLLALAAASTFYVSPTGELLFYAAEHDNDGPGETVRAGEWRHVDVVRAGSPTLKPGAELGGPFEVDEGSVIALSGSGRQPITKAYIQLFNERNYGPGYLTVDYADRHSDDFNNLFDFESNLANRAKSWSWFAPQGCSIQAIDRVDENSDVDEMKTLTGVTDAHGDPDLSTVMHDGGTDDIDQEIDRVLFAPDCDSYYSAAIGLYWDLDRNGSFESQGSPVNFSAATIDGPASVQVPVEARNPLGGPAGSVSAPVTVKNVAPLLAGFQLTDGIGNVINVTVPWVVTGMPVTVSSNFADPGIPDHQASHIMWGDGATDLHTAFNVWDEAFGDGTGRLSDSHRYSAAGIFPIELKVSDDDLGVSTAGASVRVLTREQAVNEIIAIIDAAIAAATDPTVRAQLQHARHELTGSNANSNNGALLMIQNGNDLAAAAFTQTSATWLRRAAEGGANVAVAIALLDQLTAALGG